MPFEQTILPQYRDADPDGLIGLKGCMHSFQDIHTYYMHSIHKGNDELPEQTARPGSIPGIMYP